MATDVHKLPSFSAERLRGVAAHRSNATAAAGHRRAWLGSSLNYYAPLLSARRHVSPVSAAAAAGEGGGETGWKAKLWKLSAELSKESLRVPGAVPFDWEQSPGRPKEEQQQRLSPNSSSSVASLPSSLETRPAANCFSQITTAAAEHPPSSSPSFPSPPTTAFLPPDSTSTPLPSPPPVSPSSALVDPHPLSLPLSVPPPPPPPPPPRAPSSAPPPRAHLSTRSSSSAPAPPQIHGGATRHPRVHGGFLAFDPTADAGFLRILQARRKLAEPDDDESASQDRNSQPQFAEPSIPLSSQIQMRSSENSTVGEESVRPAAVPQEPAAASCAIPSQDHEKKELLEVYDDIVTEFGASQRRPSCIGSAVKLGSKEGGVPGVGQTPPAADLQDRDSSMSEESAEAALVAAAERSGSAVGCKISTDVPSTITQSGSDGGTVDAETAPKQGNGDVTLISGKDARGRTSEANKKPFQRNYAAKNRRDVEKQSERRTQSGNGEDEAKRERRWRAGRRKQEQEHHQSMASCRAESIRFVTAAAYDACRKAANVTVQTLARSKRKVMPSVRASLALLLLRSSVARPGKAAGAAQQQRQRQQDAAAAAQPYTDPIHPGGDGISSPPAAAAEALRQNCQNVTLQSMNLPDVDPSASDDRIAITSSPALQTRAPAAEVADGEGENSPIPEVMYEFEETNDRIGSPTARLIRSMSGTSAAGFTVPREEAGETDIATTSPAAVSSSSTAPAVVLLRHSISLGKEDVADFFDAPSRFPSRSSTPARTGIVSPASSSHSYYYCAEDHFLDASSSPFSDFTPPRLSRSSTAGSNQPRLQNHHHPATSAAAPPVASMAPSSNSQLLCPMFACKKPQSKLSKRVGKTLSLDMKGIQTSTATTAVNGIDLPLQRNRNGSCNEADSVGSVSAYDKAPFISHRPLASAKGTSEYGDQAVNQQENGTNAVAGRRSFVMGQRKKKTGVQQVSPPVFPAKCQKNRLNVLGTAAIADKRSSTLSSRHPLIYNCSAADVGWPLGISGYPEALLVLKSVPTKHTACNAAAAVPSPPVPPSPVGGSWLKKALTCNKQLLQYNSNMIRVAGLSPTKKKPTGGAGGKSWEDMVRGSHGLMYGEEA